MVYCVIESTESCVVRQLFIYHTFLRQGIQPDTQFPPKQGMVYKFYIIWTCLSQWNDKYE